MSAERTVPAQEEATAPDVAADAAVVRLEDPRGAWAEPQVVFTMNTEHDALCVTVLGTLPRTRRFMPLLPTTRTSAWCWAARLTSTSAGSPVPMAVRHSIPRS